MVPSILIADAFVWFKPLVPWPVAVSVAGVIAGVTVAAWLVERANPVSNRRSLWIVRGAVLATVAVILLNPVRVDELPGPIERSEMFYMLDTSASMQMGNPRSRWDESLRLIRQANEQAPAAPAIVKPFRFGQRLAAIEQLDQIGLAARPSPSSAPLTPVSATESAADKLRGKKPVGPTDGDTRLFTALRQISSRFGRVPPQGIVLFSDGRAREESGLDQLAAEFARLKVPIHVVPVGDTTKGGDVAVAAVVAPARVRKFTEVEVQVFVRSFGYDGKRSEVHLQEVQADGSVGRELAPPLPITLQSGYQSVSLMFRTDMTTRRLRVAISPLSDEVSAGNNQIDAEMAIDRTKVRVLYIEGSTQPLQQVRVADRYQLRGPFNELKQALTEDEDIECVVLIAQPGGRLMRIAEYSQVDGVRGFPTSVAELAAFDALILSNVAADALTEKQREWIEQWIGQRGGGLCMVGGENSFSSGGWSQTPLASMLPVEMLEGGYDWLPGETVRVTPELSATPHALWHLLADDKQNREVAATFPPVMGINRWAGVRSNLTTVLAQTTIASMPVAALQPAAPNLRSFSAALGNLVGARPMPVAKTGSATAVAAAEVPAIVTGRFGRGRTAAIAFPITSPYADELVQKWGSTDNRYYAKFARNLVYWLTESSAIGRRRLVASADKRFYRPGETITIQAATYDESAAVTKNYRVVAMVEPHTPPSEAEPEVSPLRWPSGLARTSGESGPFIVWGEEFELALAGKETPLHGIQLPLNDVLASGASSQSLRVELTAYEEQTQVDSTSLDIQVLHDPFEQQNPFPNHALLTRLASASGGKVLRTADELAAVLKDVPVNVGPPIVRRSPLWSKAWVLLLLLGLLTGEWCWRRTLGLA